MFGRKKQPRLRDVMREMSYGGDTELRDPEDIDRELSEEEAEAEEENRVVDLFPLISDQLGTVEYGEGTYHRASCNGGKDCHQRQSGLLF